MIIGSVVPFNFLVQAGAAELYNYQTGQVENQSCAQSGVDDQNYRQATSSKKHFYSGGWSLTLGVSGAVGPKYDGSSSYEFQGEPEFSLDKAGEVEPFSSRNDNPSITLFGWQRFSMGLVGKIITQRDSDTSRDLRGLSTVKWGGEIGGFAMLYPIDGLRLYGELRHGIRSHSATTADLAADLYQNITPKVQVSAGPRAFYATKDYFKTYYGVSNSQSLETGLSPYDPDGGWGAIGLGGAVTWKTTDKITTSLFGEYSRLRGPAANSSLVEQRGSKDQLTVGISASYRFDFNLR